MNEGERRVERERIESKGIKKGQREGRREDTEKGDREGGGEEREREGEMAHDHS